MREDTVRRSGSLWVLMVALFLTLPFTHDAGAQAKQKRRPSVTAAGANLLPEVIGSSTSGEGVRPADHWTIPDIVEVTRITGVAIQGKNRTVAFILKQPSIAQGEDRYGLYVISADRTGPARKVLEAAYLADLQVRPGTSMWTFRGDIGHGVHLYGIDRAGRPQPLVVNSQPASVGGYHGLVISSHEGPRMTGVLGYEWAPDGSALWYSKLKLLSAAERRSLDDGGIVVNDAKTTASIEMNAEPAALAVELRVFDPASGKDRIIATVPGDRPTAQFAFQREGGSAAWIDVRHITYRLVTVADDGSRSSSRWVVDVDTAQATQATGRSFSDAFGIVSTPDGDLIVRREGDGGRLVAVANDGAIKKDYGSVAFTRMDGGLGYWRDAKTSRSVLGVHYPNHDGLMMFPPSGAGSALAKIADDLTNCAFVADLSLGVCNRENLTTAPELVAVEPANGALTVLARPNARYDRIAPLRTVYTRWTNRFGAVNDGYVTYPRGYQPGRRYPALVVTHGNDAQNQFAYQGFQWDYPIQVFAERGYFVLSVNEPRRDPAAANAYSTGSTDVPVAKMQFEWGFKVIASMEAAAQSLVDQGMLDPGQIGIAGYSRGASVTTMTLSQSKIFRAGASGDANWFSAGGYWGSAVSRGIYKGLFGGSPMDPKAYNNYLAFSPSARAAQFAGPLLQQFAAGDAERAVELDEELKDANVPTELVFYRDETHLLHQPRHRAWAEQLGLDWFDYWLLDRRDPDSSKAQQYERWDAMAERWRVPKTSPK
jgi:dipeptidyl aminopeptidase/acylaminoacyl peptidase